MNAKKITAGFLCALTLMGTSAALSLNAAGNYTDSSYSFKVSNSSQYTDYRQKLDATSATIKVSSGSSVIVRVYGSKSSGTIFNNGTDCTVGTPKTVAVSTKYTYLPNLVKESGYSYARLGLTSASGNSFTSTGVWSPDSI